MVINAMVRLINFCGFVVFIIASYASLSLVTQSNAVAGPVIGSDCTVGGCLFNPAAVLDTTQVDDLRPTADRYGAGGGAVCGSDAQCRAWDHDHGITDHQLPVDPRDPHDANRAVLDDAAAEGQDVLVAEYETTPAQLWDALLDAGFRGDPTDGSEALYVPVDSQAPTVSGDDGFYWATLDGFYFCPDGAAFCTYVDVPTLPATPSV